MCVDVVFDAGYLSTCKYFFSDGKTCPFVPFSVDKYVVVGVVNIFDL